MIRPGYFAGDTRTHLHAGDEIHITACGGSKVPSEWQRAILVVEENPNTRQLPLIVAILHRYRAPTPVRHDAEPDETTESRAA